jgi:predicted AlkP superfamily pyrophosphatase or phosphodiesterase
MLQLICVSTAMTQEPLRVLIISIDGLRSDVVTKNNTPNLQALTQKGAYTFNAQSQVPTFTIPNHVSMVTGVRPITHGVVTPPTIM